MKAFEAPLRAYWKARAALCRRANVAETCLCGATLRRTHEPVTVGGWYGDFHMGWARGRCVAIDALCIRCRTREAYTPTSGVPDDSGGWWIAPAIPALAGKPGPGGADGYDTVTEALERLEEYARHTGLKP